VESGSTRDVQAPEASYASSSGLASEKSRIYVQESIVTRGSFAVARRKFIMDSTCGCEGGRTAESSVAASSRASVR
jgi:hypothetical protein